MEALVALLALVSLGAGLFSLIAVISAASANARVRRLEERIGTGSVSRDPRETVPVPIPAASRAEEPGPEQAPVPRESYWGTILFGSLGAIAILFGTGFFFLVGWFLVPPIVRVAIGGAAGLAGIAFGEWLTGTRFSRVGRAIVGCGLMVLYASVAAAHIRYDLVAGPVAIGGLLGVTAVSVWLAVRRASRILGGLALLGGFLVPILLRSTFRTPESYFLFLGLLAAGALVCSLAPALRGMEVAALPFLALDAALREGPVPYRPVLLFHLAVAGAYFLRAAEPALRRGVAPGRAAAAGSVLAGAYAALRICALLSPEREVLLGSLLFAMSIVFLSAAYAARATTLEGLRAGWGGLGLLLAAAAWPFLFDREPVAIAWTIQYLAALGAGFAFRAPRLRAAAFLLFLPAILQALLAGLGADVWGDWTRRPIANLRFATTAGLVVASYTAGRLYRRFADRAEGFERYAADFGLLLGHLLTLWAGTVEILSGFAWGGGEEMSREFRWARDLSISAWWGLYTTGLLAGGMLLHRRPIRYLGLGGVLFTALKVFTYDLAGLDLLYRVASFLGLGVLLFGIAFLYHLFERSEKNAS